MRRLHLSKNDQMIKEWQNDRSLFHTIQDLNFEGIEI